MNFNPGFIPNPLDSHQLQGRILGTSSPVCKEKALIQGQNLQMYTFEYMALERGSIIVHQGLLDGT